MEAIAVIGFAFKLPGGAEDESSLWDVLQEARNVMKEYPPSRVNLDTFYNPTMNRNNTVSHYCKIRNVVGRLTYLALFQRSPFC